MIILRITICTALLFSQYSYPIYRCLKCGGNFMDSEVHNCFGELIGLYSEKAQRVNERQGTTESPGSSSGIQLPVAQTVYGVASGMPATTLPAILPVVDAVKQPQSDTWALAQALNDKRFIGGPIMDKGVHRRIIAAGEGVLKRTQDQNAIKEKQSGSGNKITDEFVSELRLLMEDRLVLQVVFHDQGCVMAGPFYLRTTKSTPVMVQLILPLSPAPIVFQFALEKLIQVLKFIQERYRPYVIVFIKNSLKDEPVPK